MDELELRILTVETLLLCLIAESPPGSVDALREAMREGLDEASAEERAVRQQALITIDEALSRVDLFTLGGRARRRPNLTVVPPNDGPS